MFLKRAALTIGIFAFALSAAAGDAGKLPDGILAHISAKSADGLLTNLDDFLVGCTRNTPYASQYQPGMLSMVSVMFSPIPVTALELTGPMHVLAVKMGNREEPEFVFILKTSGMADFRKNLEEGGMEVEDENGRLRERQSVRHPLLFADAGNDFVLCAISPGALDLASSALENWKPAHAGGADVSCNLDLKNIMAAYKSKIDEVLAETRDKLDRPAEEFGGIPGAERPFALAMAKMTLGFLEKAERQLSTIANQRIDLSFSGERMTAAFALSADGGSALDAIRAFYDGKANPEYRLVQTMPRESLAVGGYADISGFQKELTDFYGEVLLGVAREVMPDKAEELAGLPAEFTSLGFGEMASGVYMSGDNLVNVSSMECGDTGKFMELLSKTTDLGNQFIKGMMEVFKGKNLEKKVDMELAFKPEEGKVEGERRGRFSIKFKAQGEEIIVPFRGMVSAGDSIATTVYGNLPEEDLEHALGNLGNDGDGFFNSAEAATAVNAIQNRQIGVMVARPFEMMKGFFINQVSLLRNMDMDFVKIVAARLKSGPECVAVGFGAAGGALVAEGTISAKTIADLVRNIKAIDGFRDALRSDNSGDMDGENGEDSGEEYSEEAPEDDREPEEETASEEEAEEADDGSKE